MASPFKVVKSFLREAAERSGVRPKRSYGLRYLDKKLAIHLRKRRGFFVEAGANDGVRQSNTLFFERYYGWRGILIEPIPDLAERCRQNRPLATVVEAALVPSSFSASHISMSYCDLMSIVDHARGGEAEDREHLERGKKFLRNGDAVARLDVPARRLSAILDETNAPPIDLLSLDVEGFEAQALAGLDWDRHAPEWILVEANDQGAIECQLGERYRLFDILSHHDILYRRQ